MDCTTSEFDGRSSGLIRSEMQLKTVEKVNRQLSNSSVTSSFVNPGRFYVEIKTREEKEILLKAIEAFKLPENRATKVSLCDNSKPMPEILYHDEQDGILKRFGFRRNEASHTSNETGEVLLEKVRDCRNSMDSIFLNPGRLYVTEEDMQVITKISSYEQTLPVREEKSFDSSTKTKFEDENMKYDSIQRPVLSDLFYDDKTKIINRDEFLLDANKIETVRVEKFEPLSSIPETGHDISSIGYENKSFSDPVLSTDVRVRYIGSEDAVHIDMVKPELKATATHVKQERDGKITDLTSGSARESTTTSSRARERFRQAAEKVKAATKEIRPKKIPGEDFALWKDRGSCGWFGLLATFGGILAFFADIALDLKVAVDHFRNSDYWWGTLTASLVILPSFIVNLVSFFWYLEDEEMTGHTPETGWKRIYVIHICQLGLAERSWRILKKGWRIMRKHNTKLYDYQIFISRNLDLAMLQMFLAFTEDAPQLVLQLYVLVRRRLLKTDSISEIWTIISICFSFFSYSRALVNYIMCLRDSKRHKGRLRWYGYLSMWLWRAFMIISRMLVLVFFASAFKGWFFLVFGLHYVLVFYLLGRQEVSFFPGHTCKQYFFRAIVAYIHIFCFFSLDGVRTISWACKYYTMTFVENLTLTLLWYFSSTIHLNKELEISGLVVVFVFYFIGLVIMCVYYKFLHPKFKHPKLDKLMSWTGLGSEESAAIDEERKKSEEVKDEPQVMQKWELWV